MSSVLWGRISLLFQPLVSTVLLHTWVLFTPSQLPTILCHENVNNLKVEMPWRPHAVHDKLMQI